MTKRHTIALTGNGFSIHGCFGAGGCEHRALNAPNLPEATFDALNALEIADRLEQRLGHPPRAHNLIKVSISYCPNACARSQIADIGLIGASLPGLAPENCIACAACESVCRETAIEFDSDGLIQQIAADLCVCCGACAKVCPSQAITIDQTGFRLLLGGKLGRHPQFGIELPGLYAEQLLPQVIIRCVNHHLSNMAPTERFGDVVNRLGAAAMVHGEQDG